MLRFGILLAIVTLSGCTTVVDGPSEPKLDAPSTTLSNCQNFWAPAYLNPVTSPSIDGWLDSPAPILQDSYGFDVLHCEKWSIGPQVIKNGTIAISSRSNQQPPDSCMEHFDFYPQLVQGIAVSHQEIRDALNWGPLVELSEIALEFGFREGESTSISFSSPRGEIDLVAVIVNDQVSAQSNTLTLAMTIGNGVRFVEIPLSGEGVAHVSNTMYGSVTWPDPFTPLNGQYLGGLTQYRNFSTTIETTEFADTECTEHA